MDVAVVSVLVTGAVGLGGVGLAFREQGLRRELAEIDRTHQLQMARYQQTYADRRDVYLEVADYLERWALVVQRTDPMIAPAGAPGPPTVPSEDEQIKLQGRIAVLGSDVVNDGLQTFARAASAFRFANLDYLQLQRSATEGLVEAGRNREAERTKVREQLVAIEALMRRELSPSRDASETPELPK
jgi:hypothetical protein